MERSNNDLDMIESQLLFLGIEDKDSLKQSSEGRIQHKIDASKLQLIKWSKIQSMIDEILLQHQSCFYELRVYNTEINTEIIPEILSKIQSISEGLGSKVEIIKLKQGLFGIFFELIIKINSNELIQSLSKKQNEIKIAAFGEESSGKSTTLSVLVNEDLDDGNGKMRKKTFRFQHEFQTGKTLSICHLIYGIDKNNNRLNGSWEDLIQSTARLVNLYDMGGSEKAMKNTLSLISSDYIDHFLLFVNILQGPTENTRILFLLANSIHIPVISVITFCELEPKAIEAFIKQYKEYLIKLKPDAIPMEIKSTEDVLFYANHSNENYIPILCVSNINGMNINLLSYLLSHIPNMLDRTIPLINNAFEEKGFNFVSSPQSQFDVHEHFNVESKTIIGGVVSKGRIVKGENYFFGPNKLGNFKLLEVESIHCKKQEVQMVFEGQFSSISLKGKNYESSEIRKGMCLLGTTDIPKAAIGFTVDLWNIESSLMKEIKYKYEPVVIINHIRQACRIKFDKVKNTTSIEDETLSQLTQSTSRLTDADDFYEDKKKRKSHKIDDAVFYISCQEKITLTFEFKNAPEYLTQGSNIIINDNNVKAFGIITSVKYKN